MNPPRRQFSPRRKTVYYLGISLSAIGALLFFSVFITGALNFGNHHNFQGQVRSAALRSTVGMVMMIAGGALMALGRSGLAGSGLLLDPEQARHDVEPWSRMTGGMVHDALSEVDVVNQIAASATRPEVKIRCRACQALNDESAKFCNQCGSEI